MNKLQIQGITYDLQYFFTDRGLVKISLDENDFVNGNFIDYNHQNFGLGLKLMKENIQVKFDIGLITKDEYIFSARKFIYESLNVVKLSNQISIISEWENNYGKNLLLIRENNDNTDSKKIFDKSWDGLEKLFTKNLSESLIYERSWLQWGWDNIKSTISKAFTCAKGSGYIDCFMEGLRTIATSVLGVTILTGVSFIPIYGNIPNYIIFGALLTYDIYKMVTGKKWSVSDIVVDIVSLLAPSIAGRIGKLTKGLTSFWGLGKLAGSGLLGKTIQVISKGIGGLATYIGQAAGYFASKLGIKWLADMAKSSDEGLQKIKKEIDDGKKSTEKGKKEVEKDGANKEIPAGWEKYPCVINSKNVVEKKLSDGTIVYEGGGYFWINDGRRVDKETREVSNYSCGSDGKVKIEPTTSSIPDKETLPMSSDEIITYKKCNGFPLSVGCLSDDLKFIQRCLDLPSDGKFTKELENKLKEKDYGNTITKDIYNKIILNCTKNPESSQDFSKITNVFSQEL